MGLLKSIGFSQTTTSTPKVNLISTATIAPNTATNVILNRTTLTTTVPEIVQIFSLTNPSVVFNVSTWATNSTQLNLSVTLNSGNYGFKMFDDLYGWYSYTNTTFLSVSKSASTYAIATTLTSFNGGTV